MRRRALLIGLVTSSLLGGAVGAGSAAGAAPLAAPAAGVRAASSVWPVADPGVADPADTVAVPRTAEVSPIPRRVLASSGGTRLILQPDTDGVWWLWWQQGTTAPVRSAQQVRAPRSLDASASSAHVVVHDAGYLDVDVDARTITPLTLESGWTFVAATPDGYVDVNRTTKVLRRHLAGGSTSTLATDAFFTTSPGNRPAAADATGVVLSDGGVRWYPFDGGPSVVLATDQFVPDTFAVSPSSVAWTTRAFAGDAAHPAQPPSVRRVLKAGGPVATHTVDELITDLAISDDATAWSGLLLNGTGTAAAGTRFAGVGNGDLSQVTALPALSAASAVAEGDHLLLTDDAPASEAGLYAVTVDGTVTLQTRTTPPLRRVGAFAFDGSRVVEQQLENESPKLVGQQVVDGAGFTGVQPIESSLSDLSPVTLAVSAGLAAVQGSATEFSDLEAGRPTYRCCDGAGGGLQQVEVSGTTAAVASAVVDMTTGQTLATLPGARSRAVFGATVVWSTDTGEVWRRTTTTAPVKVLGAACTSGCAAQVGLWGDRLVVQPKVGDLQVRTAAGTLLRSLPALPAADSSSPPALTLEDGVLAWVQPVSGTHGVLRVTDVDASTPAVVDVAQAVRLPGLRAVELRDGRLLWLAPDRGLRAARLPLARHPRVVPLEVSAPSAFSPNGDTVQDDWKLTGIASAPLAGQVTVEIARSGSVVRTLTADSRSGRFALSWDGRTASGASAAEGVYSWSLQGTSVAGEPLTGLAGPVSGPVSGTVALRRVGAGAVISAPVLSTDASTTTAFPVSFRATTTQPAWSPPQFQLAVRPYWNGNRPSSAAFWSTWTTTSAQRVWFDPRRTSYPDVDTWLLRVRVVSPGGVVGPWSSTVRTTLPVDDTTPYVVSYGGAWKALRQSWAYRGTQHQAGPGWGRVTFTPQHASSAVAVVMTTCSHCGKIRLSVDGTTWRTIDTYSSTTRSRRVVYQTSLRWGVHWIKIDNLGTAGRPYAYVDGVSFRP